MRRNLEESWNQRLGGAAVAAPANGPIQQVVEVAAGNNAHVGPDLNARVHKHSDNLWYRVPEGWKFPSSVTVEQLWRLWWAGMPIENIGSFRFFDRLDISKCKAVDAFAKAKVVIDLLTRAYTAAFHDVSVDDIASDDFDRIQCFRDALIEINEFMMHNKLPLVKPANKYFTVYDKLRQYKIYMR
jgi:hypothetical protein